MSQRIVWANRLLLVLLVLLPWQTRWIFSVPLIGGDPSEFGQLSLYATEVILFVVLLLRGRPLYSIGLQWVRQAGYFFLAVAFFSLGFSDFFQIGLAHILHLLFAFAFLCVLCDVRTSHKRVAVAFVLGLMLPAALGWIQFVNGNSPAITSLGLAAKDAQTAGVAVVESGSIRMLRAYGPFPHPNMFGGYLAVSLVVLAWLVRYIHSRRDLLLSVIPVVVLSATLIITFSRSAWLGITIGFLVLISLMLWRHRIAPSRAMPIILLGLVTILSTLLVFHRPIFSRMQASGYIEQISVKERQSQYGWVDDIFRANPLLGVGPGAYTFSLAQLDPGAKVWDYQPIHNVYLLILSELGAIGFLALLYLLIRVDQVSSRVSKTAGGMLGVSLGVVLLTIGLFDHYLWSLWPGLALTVVSLSFVLNWAILDPTSNRLK